MRPNRDQQKPKIGIFGFTSCAGCQLEIINLEERLLALLSHVDVVNFPMAKSKNPPDKLDIALIDGSIVLKEQIKELKEIRERSKLLVAIGTCAMYGGVQSLRNSVGINKAKQMVYGDSDLNFNFIETKPLEEYVKVDFGIPGCPIDRDEFLNCTIDLLLGKKPKLKAYSICTECKKKENICLLIEDGLPCMGPVTVAGCGARCPSNHSACEGCRGPVEDVNVAGEIQILQDKGIDYKSIVRKFNMFTNGVKEYQGVK